MKKFVHKAGTHFALPQEIKVRNKPEKVTWRCKFGANTNYDLKDVDQLDWNKLLGLYYNLLNTMADTVMVGWRYNKEMDLIEMNAYYHVDKGRDYTETLMTVKREEEFLVTILVDYNKKTYTVILERPRDGKKVQDSFVFNHNRKLAMDINTWFGGNEKAPQEIHIFKEVVQ